MLSFLLLFPRPCTICPLHQAVSFISSIFMRINFTSEILHKTGKSSEIKNVHKLCFCCLWLKTTNPAAKSLFLAKNRVDGPHVGWVSPGFLSHKKINALQIDYYHIGCVVRAEESQENKFSKVFKECFKCIILQFNSEDSSQKYIDLKEVSHSAPLMGHYTKMFLSSNV